MFRSRCVLMCRHLWARSEGPICTVTDEFIRKMPDADIDVCLSMRKFEECTVYKTRPNREMSRSSLEHLAP